MQMCAVTTAANAYTSQGRRTPKSKKLGPESVLTQQKSTLDALRLADEINLINSGKYAPSQVGLHDQSLESETSTD